MKVIKAPDRSELFGWQHPILFSAGSIEMGQAEMWQERLAREFESEIGTFLNPRRDDWDSTWVQSFEHRQFREQVEWELLGLDMADVVPIYFAPDMKAPITLLELGLVARRAKAVVCCPPGFYRRGNVEVVCRSFGVPLHDTWRPWVDEIRRYLRRCS